MLMDDNLSWTIKGTKIVRMKEILTEGIQKTISRIDEDIQTKVKPIIFIRE